MTSAVLDSLLQQARIAEGQGFNSFELNSRQNFELQQFTEHLQKSRGMSPSTARAVAVQAVNRPGIGNRLREEIATSGDAGHGLVAAMGPVLAPSPGNPLSAGKMGFKVTRVTADIAAPLPFCIGGPLDAQNGYRRVIQGMLPPTFTLDSVEIGESDGQPTGALFTYTDPAGPDTDTVLVESTTYPYPAILESMITDLLELTKIRVTLSDDTQITQFDQEIVCRTSTMFGLTQQDPDDATSFRTPQNLNSGIVDVDNVYKLDKETLIVSQIIPVAGFSVKYNAFARRFDRRNAIGWGNAY